MGSVGGAGGRVGGGWGEATRSPPAAAWPSVLPGLSVTFPPLPVSVFLSTLGGCVGGNGCGCDCDCDCGCDCGCDFRGGVFPLRAKLKTAPSPAPTRCNSDPDPAPVPVVPATVTAGAAGAAGAGAARGTGRVAGAAGTVGATGAAAGAAAVPPQERRFPPSGAVASTGRFFSLLGGVGGGMPCDGGGEGGREGIRQCQTNQANTAPAYAKERFHTAHCAHKICFARLPLN